MLKNFKGRRLILVTPYDGRYANDQSSESVQTRLYEFGTRQNTTLSPLRTGTK